MLLKTQNQKVPKRLRALCLGGALAFLGVLLATGCQNVAPTTIAPYSSNVPQGEALPTGNPLVIIQGDPYQVWETVVDVVRLYFDRIEFDNPCQQVGNVITEGSLKTYPQTAATVFEPWRKDSVTCSDRREATVQSLRRIAEVQVRYTPRGYVISVQVNKELEDLAAPSYAQLPSATFRLDTDVPEVNDPIAVQAYNQGWIPQGRDVALEQRILQQIHMRLAPAQ